MKIAVVGTGVIGESWVRLFLEHGHDVVVWDPAPQDLPGVTLVDDPAAAVADADFVQENGPERLEVKHDLLAVLDGAARDDVVIAAPLRSRRGQAGRGRAGRPAGPCRSDRRRAGRRCGNRWSPGCPGRALAGSSAGS